MTELEEIVKKASGRSKPGKEPDIPLGIPQILNQENIDYRCGFNDGFLQGYEKGIKKDEKKGNMKDIIDEILDLFEDVIANACVDSESFTESREEYATKLEDLFDYNDKLMKSDNEIKI